MEVSLNELYSNVSDLFNNPALIRHYKIIKRKDYNSNVNKLDDYTYEYEDYLSQDTDNYENKAIIDYIILQNHYKDESLVNLCDHNKYILNGKHYDDINSIKNDIINKNANAEFNYINEITHEDFSSKDKNNIKQCLNYYIKNYVDDIYIRMAPPKDEKDIMLERIYYLQGIEPLVNSDDEKLYSNDGVPIYNDNIIYSNIKYKKLTKNTVNELLENNYGEDLNITIEEL